MQRNAELVSCCVANCLSPPEPFGQRCGTSERPILDGGTDGSNPVPSSAESAANFVFGREAWKGPRRRQGTIPTVSTSSGTDGSNPAPSSGESGANLSLAG